MMKYRRKSYLEIPNEALKNKNAKFLLLKFFNLCFKSGFNPTDWDYSEIIPIPKKGKDSRDPLQNRCISIVCCVAKIYTSILNKRLQIFLEKNDILAEEQNGFRAGRSCVDHIFVMCTVLRNRLTIKKHLILLIEIFFYTNLVKLVLLGGCTIPFLPCTQIPNQECCL